MTKVALRDVVAVAGGGTPRKSVPAYYGGGIPWVTPKDMKRPLIGESEVTLTDDGVRNSPAKLVAEGSVLVVVRSGVLKHTLPVALTTRPVTVNQDMKALTPRRGLEPSYLARMLKALQPTVLSWVRATTADNFPIGNLLDLEIDLPPLPEQRRVAAILDHADALRTKRHQVLTHLDSLAQSIFNDMFGDLHSSTWERVPFGDVVPKVENGTSPNCETRPAGDKEWGVLKLGAVTYGHFRATENKAYLGDLGGMAQNEVRPGDVLMTRKNTRELVGAVALVDQVRPRLLLPDLVFRLHLDMDRLDRRYFHALMMSPQKRPSVRDLSSGSAASMPNISKARLATLPLELPPMPLQKEYASKVEGVGAMRARLLDGTATADALFASLQSRAFRGGL